MIKPTLALALAVAVLSAGPAAASDKTDVMVPVKQFVDGFNKGDVKSALAACADETSIIDDIPPHEWHGAGACAKWAADLDAAAKANGMTDIVVILGKSRHVNVTGDRAYVVVPASLAFKLKGKPVKEGASTWTLALQRTAAAWRITGWAWAKH
jgi:hypothetical protein